jgi:hypothetical protein
VKCKVEDCERRAWARGLCEMHLARLRRHGDLLARRYRTSGCLVPGCRRPHAALGLCYLHYERSKSCGDVAVGRRVTVGCSVSGCGHSHKARGLCYLHYARFKKHGDPLLVTRERHGMSASGAHRSWEAMRERCRRKSAINYSRYGGKGVDYDSAWSSFAKFYADMGERPEGCHLHRVDSSLGYFKSNCIWLPGPDHIRLHRTLQKGGVA